MESRVQDRASGQRIHFLDNLRTAMIFLVVLYHAGVVYESSGFFAPFWLVDDPATNNVAGLVNLLIDIFIMPTIFFVSGYFAPISVGKKTGKAFLSQRFKRLMVPWIMAVLTLMPLYKVIFLYSRGLPQEHWTTYFHFSNGALSQSWLWFLPVLFAFDILFWLMAKTKIRVPEISLARGVAAVFVIGVLYSFGVSMLGNSGWTKTILVDFQNEKLLTYFLVFLLGALSHRLRVFDTPPNSKRLYIAANCTAWIPINVYVLFLLNMFFRPGTWIVSPMVDVLVLWCAYYLSMLFMLYLLVATFRFYRSKESRLGRVLNPNSYNVYILHMAVIGGLALALLNTDIPSLWKYLILTISAYVVSNLLASGIRGIEKGRIRS